MHSGTRLCGYTLQHWALSCPAAPLTPGAAQWARSQIPTLSLVLWNPVSSSLSLTTERRWTAPAIEDTNSSRRQVWRLTHVDIIEKQLPWCLHYTENDPEDCTACSEQRQLFCAIGQRNRISQAPSTVLSTSSQYPPRSWLGSAKHWKLSIAVAGQAYWFWGNTFHFWSHPCPNHHLWPTVHLLLRPSALTSNKMGFVCVLS